MSKERNYKNTLNLPKTDFPMKASLVKKEEEILKDWEVKKLFAHMQDKANKRKAYILHDGPPYANGDLHMGHALNKILKDIICRSQQMMGRNAVYVPGWDCHGLPIEWKIEEQYRAKGKNKDDVPLKHFRQECRQFAKKWIEIQKEQFQRLGVMGDWDNPYTTMSHRAESIIVKEFHKFLMAGDVYLGEKPVMWSPTERTALAEAEIDYKDYVSPSLFVKFRVSETKNQNLKAAALLIWTTTPWTLPANRALSYGPHLTYGLYELETQQKRDFIIICDLLAEQVMKAHQQTNINRISSVEMDEIKTAYHPLAQHPQAKGGYDFKVPLLPAHFVSDETGTGLVHIAPSHGQDDYELGQKHQLETPSLINEAGMFYESVPLFGGHYILEQASNKPNQNPTKKLDNKTNDKPNQTTDNNPNSKLYNNPKSSSNPDNNPNSNPDNNPNSNPDNNPNSKLDDDSDSRTNSKPDSKPDKNSPKSNPNRKPTANEAVIQALIETNALSARAKWHHSYPHSWRSKAPVIFRNTQQCFISMTHNKLRQKALQALLDVKFHPPSGRVRLESMIEERPDWVISRQRAWGVPLAIFIHKQTGKILRDHKVSCRIIEAIEQEGADIWFERDPQYFLGDDYQATDYDQVKDILDVWFDSGSTHAFVLEDRQDLKSPADLYLEGSDQHRGWFQSSLLVACGTRQSAPYKNILTHGFVLDEEGYKLSKSSHKANNPQELVRQYGADVLRLWVASSDWTQDLCMGEEVMKTAHDAYRKIRNGFRFLLGNLSGFAEDNNINFEELPELERYILHKLFILDGNIKQHYQSFQFSKIIQSLLPFITNDLSAFYFDIRKDTLYCEHKNSIARRACLTVLNEICKALSIWLAPILCFTMEEVFKARHQKQKTSIHLDSIHLEPFPLLPTKWHNETLSKKWQAIRSLRGVVTAALEIARKEKQIGSSLEAAPLVYIKDKNKKSLLDGLAFEDICITSQISILDGAPPKNGFMLPDEKDVSVIVEKAKGKKNARAHGKSSPPLDKTLIILTCHPEMPKLLGHLTKRQCKM